MRLSFDTPAHRRAVLFTLALSAVLVFALFGCKSTEAPNTETQGAVDSTGTVQAPLPGEATVSVVPSGTPSAATTTAPKPAPTLWPEKVGKFAKAEKIPVWYPKSLPSGFKIDTVDIVELDKGTGLICDEVLVKGDKAILFTQGSPTQRSYDIVSAGKVPWGNETADIVLQDPQDPSSPPIIVYFQGGNFAELQGDLTLAQLKAIAASMVRVR
jgi:hypothetical protein